MGVPLPNPPAQVPAIPVPGPPPPDGAPPAKKARTEEDLESESTWLSKVCFSLALRSTQAKIAVCQLVVGGNCSAVIESYIHK